MKVKSVSVNGKDVNVVTMKVKSLNDVSLSEIVDFAKNSVKKNVVKKHDSECCCQGDLFEEEDFSDDEDWEEEDWEEEEED